MYLGAAVALPDYKVWLTGGEILKRNEAMGISLINYLFQAWTSPPKQYWTLHASWHL